MSWIVDVEFFLPLAQTAINKDGGLPEKMNFEPVYEEAGNPLTIDDVTLSIHPWIESREKTDAKGLMAYDRAILRAETTISNEDLMFEKVGELLDTIYDRMFFLLQKPVYTGKVWVTKPDGVTDQHSADFRLCSKSSVGNTTLLERGAESKWLKIELVDLPTDKKIDFALHWYRKAIAELVTVDKFIFLWIALEIMCNRHGDKVEVTSECVECGHKTTSMGIGRTIRSYLTSFIGIPDQQARDLWSIRQVVHGRSLNQDQENKLGHLTGLLHCCVTNALKQALNLDHTMRPLPPKQVMHVGGGWIRSGKKGS